MERALQLPFWSTKKFTSGRRQHLGFRRERYPKKVPEAFETSRELRRHTPIIRVWRHKRRARPSPKGAAKG